MFFFGIITHLDDPGHFSGLGVIITGPSILAKHMCRYRSNNFVPNYSRHKRPSKKRYIYRNRLTSCCSNLYRYLCPCVFYKRLRHPLTSQYRPKHANKRGPQFPQFHYFRLNGLSSCPTQFISRSNATFGFNWINFQIWI